MDIETQKAEFIAKFRAERAEWEALLTEVGAARMETPGVDGYWSVKDVIAHVTAYEHHNLTRVQAALRGEAPGPSPIPSGELDERNEAMYKRDSAHSVAATRAEADRIYGELLAGIAALPAEAFLTAGYYPWMKGASLAEMVEGNSIEHYHEHIPQLRAWLDQQEPATARG